jgi:ribonuclease E
LPDADPRGQSADPNRSDRDVVREPVRDPVRDPARDAERAEPRAETRTRDVNEDRTPAELDRSKRRPRRDRASVARSQEGEFPRPTSETNIPIVEALPIEAEVAAPTPATPDVVEIAAHVPEFEAVQVAPAIDSIAEAPSEAPPPRPAAVVISPIEMAAAVVQKESERPAGRAANDPREVRRREREARLRQEGVITERGSDQ